jgi:hypothetical protein
MTWQVVKRNQDMQMLLKEMKKKQQVILHLWHHKINQPSLQPGISTQVHLAITHVTKTGM